MNYNRRNGHTDLFEDSDPFNFFNVFSKDAANKIMRTDIKETEKDYVILMDVPGMSKKDITITLEQKYLTITASNVKEEVDDSKYIRKERFYGTSTRSFYVGDIEQKDIKASFDNGVLVINLPKKNYKKAEEKKYIDIN